MKLILKTAWTIQTYLNISWGIGASNWIHGMFFFIWIYILFFKQITVALFIGNCVLYVLEIKHIYNKSKTKLIKNLLLKIAPNKFLQGLISILINRKIIEKYLWNICLHISRVIHTMLYFSIIKCDSVREYYRSHHYPIFRYVIIVHFAIGTKTIFRLNKFFRLKNLGLVLI